MSKTSDTDRIRADAEKRIRSATSPTDLTSVEVSVLGRKGAVTALLKSLKDLSDADKRTLGPAMQELKKDLARRIADRHVELTAGDATTSDIDPTIPGTPMTRGTLHPVTIMLRRIWDTFTALGFEITEGPEVETDEANFQTLNIPPDHPARDGQDTFYIGSSKQREWLLRTQMTTTSISRSIPGRALPTKLIATGKCYRRDATDPTHTPVFHQFDGIVVDQGITMAHLKGVIHQAMRRILGANVAVRFRVSYFPFTEPSAEFDLTCTVCGGTGCATCKKSGWIEMGGCGMIHPTVLKNVGLDPKEVSGLAFGFGVERPFMIRHRIHDLRLFLENDLRFLTQFRR